MSSARDADDDDGADDDWDDETDSHDDDLSDEPTIPCPYCRREMFEDSPRCPHCDRYLSEEDRTWPSQPAWIVATTLVCLTAILWWMLRGS